MHLYALDVDSTTSVLCSTPCCTPTCEWVGAAIDQEVFLDGPALVGVPRLHNDHWVLKQAPGDGAHEVGRRLQLRLGLCSSTAGCRERLQVACLKLFDVLRSIDHSTRA